MRTETLDSSRLYGVIGEAARLLPDNARASLEVMLGLLEQQERWLAPRAVVNVAGAAALPVEGYVDALGCQEREALSAILEILHSSQQADGEGFGGELNDRLVEGLIVAGRLIVEERPASQTGVHYRFNDNHGTTGITINAK